MTPRRTKLARFYDQFDRTVSAPARYARGYVRTRLSGGIFGQFPSVDGRVEFGIRGSATVGNGFLVRSVTWRSRINVARDGVLQIGDDFRFNDGASIEVWHKVTIGNNVMMAPFSSIIDDHCHLVEPDSITYEKPIVIGDNVWLARNVIVMPGVTIGSGSIIGANSIVSRDIPPNSLAAGSPAKVIRTLDIPPNWTHCHGYKDYSPEASLVSSLKRVMSSR
jgi:acetyltransferase-like isoleucine patch superfamily enzyme